MFTPSNIYKYPISSDHPSLWQNVWYRSDASDCTEGNDENDESQILLLIDSHRILHLLLNASNVGLQEDSGPNNIENKSYFRPI